LGFEVVIMAFYDNVVSWFREKFVPFITRRQPSPPPMLPPPIKKIPPTVRIYSYVVRVSGYILPPAESLRKKAQNLDKDTVIQFELSFEDRPFFRTSVGKNTDCEMRYKNELKQLVKDQEIVSVQKKAFSYQSPKSNMWELWEDYNSASSTGKRNIRKDYPEEFTLGRPTFMVDDSAISFEPEAYMDVPSNRLREFKATDEFVFKIYRTTQEHANDDDFNRWDGKWEHGLS
jgi:hypothetical protein